MDLKIRLRLWCRSIGSLMLLQNQPKALAPKSSSLAPDIGQTLWTSFSLTSSRRSLSARLDMMRSETGLLQMRLKRIYLPKFKNLHDFNIDFAPDSPTTVLVGRNATGKSNLIEAIVT